MSDNHVKYINGAPVYGYDEETKSLKVKPADRNMVKTLTIPLGQSLSNEIDLEGINSVPC